MIFHRQLNQNFILLVLFAALPGKAGAQTESKAEATDVLVNYEQDVAPVFRKYCAGCHNDADREGEFSLESYSSLLKGTEDGPAFLAGAPETSVIVRLMSDASEPKMPPDGEPAPSAEEIAIVTAWIAQGAKGPKGAMPDPLALKVPVVESKTDRRPITAIAWSPDADALAVARFAEVELARELREKDAVTGKSQKGWHTTVTLKDFPGKVNSVQFCLGGGKLVTSSGVAGLGGVATLWEWPIGKKIREFPGHRDIMFDAEVSPDGTLLATCSYDRSIILWDLQTGEKLRQLNGHNGAVYDVAFSPDGTLLASASADATCKIWRVRDGERLDTLGQPLKEQYRVIFSPDGKSVAAGGADNRIRVWKLLSREMPRINPVLYSRFAHEGPIVNLAYTADGRSLVSISEDRSIKVWETETYTETQVFNEQPEVSMALAIAPNGKQFVVGRLDGTREFMKIANRQTSTETPSAFAVVTPRTPVSPKIEEISEQEPNHLPETAQRISVPAKIKGEINLDGASVDADCFKFTATAGQEWVFEIDAERSKSKLDSILEVVATDGSAIERLTLQAVRDSYFTFRGKNADESGDFRVFNWEEMELNEFLFANGEVVKLWLYPRGPDSGFIVYPGSGQRWGFFDTTPLAHALGEPCYIVKPYPPNSELIPNGLPVFKLYYQNDDESRRALGKDSKLFFTAPADGEYVIRVRDVRGMDGQDFHYQLTARPRTPDFAVRLLDPKLTIARGGGKELRFAASRFDQFDGPIKIQIDGLPAGYSTTSPIVIQEAQIEATGVISVNGEANALTAEDLKNVKMTASADVGGNTLSHAISAFQELKVDEQPKLGISIVAAAGGRQPLNPGQPGPLEFEIYPGETIMLQVKAERNGYQGEVSFGKEDAGRNFPHGLFVDNIGLNGLLLLNDQNQREFFITAAKWVPEQARLVHLRTAVAGGHATQPVLLHVRRQEQAGNRANQTGAE